MLQHIALTVNNQDEIENFYKEVLQFNTIYQFSINKETSDLIFNVNDSFDVYLMEFKEVKLEIFICQLKEEKIFSHVCLSYSDSENIYKKAVNLGYKTLIKMNPQKNTYFIWDNSNNMFEIKEL